jgi:hypothetical protein
MWFIAIPILMIVYDYFKVPIDGLYFNNPLRPLVGMRNALVDIIQWGAKYDVNHFPGLWLLEAHFDRIREEFLKSSPKKHFFHDEDPWFEVNQKYYYHKVEDFPFLNSLIVQIPSIHKETARFAVVEGPMVIAPHRAETNLLLRYHLTVQGNGDCTLYTESGSHVHDEGEAFIFDHARYHELIKTGDSKRVVLILDVHRCF